MLMRSACVLLSMVFIGLLPQTVAAQWLGFGLGGQTEFTRQLDAMRWDMRGNYSKSDSAFSISLRETFRSRLFLLNKRPQNIQDENNAALDVTAWLSKRLGVSAESRQFSFSTTNVQQFRALAGPTFRLGNYVQLKALGGIMSDARSNETDQGPAFGIRAASSPIKVGDVTFDSRLRFDHANIQPRKQNTIRFVTNTDYRQDAFRFFGSLQLGSNRRDSYQPSSFLNRSANDVIESVISDTLTANLATEFPIDEKTTGSISLIALQNMRRFENDVRGNTDPANPLFDSRLLRQQIDFRFQADRQLGFGTVSGGVNYRIAGNETRLINTGALSEEQINRRSEVLENTNYDEEELDLFAESELALGDKNRLFARGQLGIRRYDTPEINFDDRDEFSAVFVITDQHRFSKYLNARVSLAGEAFHFVYLFAQRSLENNWRRSIRLLPSLTWQPSPRLSMQYDFLVRANYTVFDFPSPTGVVNDQASRELGLRVSTDYEFARDWFVEWRGSRNELQIGQLFWDTFEETPIDTLITWETQVMLSTRKKGKRVAVGMRYFQKRDFLQQTTISVTVMDNGIERTLNRIAPGLQITHQWGPLVQIILPFNNRNEIFVDGWFQVQRVGRRVYLDFPDEFEDEFRREERRSQRRFFPNLVLRSRFYF